MASDTEVKTQQAVQRRLLNESEAAEYLNVRPPTLAAWRCTKRVNGPSYVKMGGAVRYPLEELDAFIARSVVAAGGVA